MIRVFVKGRRGAQDTAPRRKRYFGRVRMMMT